ncbi:MAG: hypothetical protein FJ033_10700 [Chloroflexi bacterium]|nr:hypothetical protein [Chloroflexota bacterium]
MPARTVIITAALEAGLSIGVACGLATYVVTFFFPHVTGVAVAAIVAACVTFTVVLHPSVRAWASGLTALPGWLRSSIEEFARVRYHIALIWFAIHVGGCVLQMGAFWLTLASIGLQPFDLDLRIGAVIAASYLSGLAVPFAPAGIGAREVFSTGLLGFWMPLADALEVTILYRFVTMSAELLTGFGGLAVWTRLRPDTAPEQPATESSLAPVAVGSPQDG